MTSTNRTSHGAHGSGHEGAHNPGVDHEHSDVNVRQILGFGVGLAVITIACAIIVRVLFGILEHQAEAADPTLSPLAIPAGQLPPEPRLQTNEPAGLKKLRTVEAETLEGYGWVDEKTGVARMPIEDAKKALLHRGLPSRAQGAGDPLEGTNAPAFGEASGGRALHMPPAAVGGGAEPPAGAPHPDAAAPVIKK
jgi:hypothetical protein